MLAILQKATLQIGLKKFLLLKKLKTLLFRGNMFLVILTIKKLLELFKKIITKSKSKKN